MEIRLEHAGDHPAVRDVHLAAFDAEHGSVVSYLTDDLRTLVGPSDGVSLVALDAGRVVGHAMFTRNLLDTPHRLVDVQVLSPLAVLPECQGQGIGSALVRRGLDILAARSVPLVFLEGPPDYYSRFGFAAGGEHGFRKPSLRIPDAAFQVTRLPAFEAWMTGTLVYSDIFWRHDAVGLREAAAHVSD